MNKVPYFGAGAILEGKYWSVLCISKVARYCLTSVTSYYFLTFEYHQCGMPLDRKQVVLSVFERLDRYDVGR